MQQQNATMEPCHSASATRKWLYTLVEKVQKQVWNAQNLLPNLGCAIKYCIVSSCSCYFFMSKASKNACLSCKWHCSWPHTFSPRKLYIPVCMCSSTSARLKVTLCQVALVLYPAPTRTCAYTGLDRLQFALAGGDHDFLPSTIVLRLTLCPW